MMGLIAGSYFSPAVLATLPEPRQTDFRYDLATAHGYSKRAQTLKSAVLGPGKDFFTTRCLDSRRTPSLSNYVNTSLTEHNAAQRLGLVDAPPMPLTAQEWRRVKTRSVDEGDSSQPCVICREEFRLQPQVLLSCSHVFHKVCLQAFEKFSGRKSCPMCRKEQYETRVIHDGARLYREKCAVRIQAYWRGYVIRKWYTQIKKTVPPKDKQLRRKFYEKKFQELNDSLVRSCDNNVDEFLSTIDCVLASSRNVFHQFEKLQSSEIKEVDWENIQEKAVKRETQDCPICLTPLCVASLGTRAKEEERRRVFLLSCSHLFHCCCLEAFEHFCIEGQPVCPLCRSLYHKRLI
ncbi:hypothetical protein JZ751_004057 [Albula glossodonta]|uniref:RING-type domain-containing protein n=1 Tax=Albula glossodonta TaxID=121402 RepID=A0A8T2PGW9_9TELE|nr:hypothetical protein JZ751_004057 [Albula glossodonta]